MARVAEFKSEVEKLKARADTAPLFGAKNIPWSPSVLASSNETLQAKLGNLQFAEANRVRVEILAGELHANCKNEIDTYLEKRHSSYAVVDFIESLFLSRLRTQQAVRTMFLNELLYLSDAAAKSGDISRFEKKLAEGRKMFKSHVSSESDKGYENTIQALFDKLEVQMSNLPPKIL